MNLWRTIAPRPDGGPLFSFTFAGLASIAVGVLERVHGCFS